MFKGLYLHWLTIALISMLSLFVSHSLASEEVTTATNNILSNEPIKPIPLEQGLDPGKVALGKRLFHEPRLSRDDSVSCAKCHILSHGGVDGLKRSIGIDGAVGSINAPTVLNSSLNFVQFWDGRAKSLEEQIDGPINNPLEMDSSWSLVIEKLSEDTEYRRDFNRIYSEGLTETNVKNAIATFERALLTPNGRFDRYLRGEVDAITREEKEGYILFKSFGCSSCHQGAAVGGNMYERMGVVVDYFPGEGSDKEKSENISDYGRFNVTGNEEHKFEFKVPSLRNIELTAPYFHNGSAATLADAVRDMAKYQLGRKISTYDLKRIVAFLHTLTGQLPGIAKSPDVKK